MIIFFFVGGWGGGVREGEDMNTRATIFFYTRHIGMTSSTDPYSLMKVFKIEGIVALTIKGR